MDLQLQGKRAFLAASSRGIGLGIAQALAAEGARLFLGGRDPEALQAAARDLSARGAAQVAYAPLDMSQGASISRWVAQGTAEFGGVDLGLINAGGPPAGLFEQFDESHWQAAFESNLLSAVRLVYALLPHIPEQGGALLSITSMSVKEPIDGLILSNVMRAGVAALVKSLARELGPKNIRFNNLLPGRIDTERIAALDQAMGEKAGIGAAEQRQAAESSIPLGRYGTIEEIGKAGSFLLSEAAAYLTGQNLAVDGGLIKAL